MSGFFSIFSDCLKKESTNITNSLSDSSSDSFQGDGNNENDDSSDGFHDGNDGDDSDTSDQFNTPDEEEDEGEVDEFAEPIIIERTPSGGGYYSDEYVIENQIEEEFLAPGHPEIAEHTSKISSTSEIFQEYSEMVRQSVAKNISRGRRVPQIVDIFLIRNRTQVKIYEEMRKVVKEENNGEENEKILFHGTKKIGAFGIIRSGFDERYFSPNGAFGVGAYFAEEPRKSDRYSRRSPPPENCFYMLVCKVLCGREKVITRHNQGCRALRHPGIGYNCIRVEKGAFGNSTFDTSLVEYVIYRYGQAVPWLLILYRK